MIAVASSDEHEWVTRQTLARDLRLSVQRIDQLRAQFGNKFERRAGNGPRAKVQICKPDWLRMWALVEASGRGAPATAFEQEFFGDEPGDWQSKCWEEKFYALRDERAKRHDRIIWRDDVHKFVTIAASELRKLGEQMQKKFGADAQDDVDDCLNNIVHHSDSYLADADSTA